MKAILKMNKEEREILDTGLYLGFFGGMPLWAIVTAILVKLLLF